MIARTQPRPQPIPFGAPSVSCRPSARSTMPPMAPTVRRALSSPTPATVGASARFLGQGSLSVQSSLTGRLYRFQGHGHSLTIDSRDALMLGRIPDLMLL